MKTFDKVICGFSLLLLSSGAFAGAYDAITAAVSFTDVVTGVVAVAALIAVVIVAKKGAHMLLSMIGR